jgi:hypothetical protein
VNRSYSSASSPDGTLLDSDEGCSDCTHSVWTTDRVAFGSGSATSHRGRGDDDVDRGGRYEDLVIPLEPSSPALERSDRWWQIYKPVDGPELHSTTFVTERTINFIEETPGEGSPWLAWASFPDPHHPMTPPGDWWRRHDPADMELPATVDDPLDNAPVDLRHVRNLGADIHRID